MAPEVGVSKPASMRSRVDLPQPEEPSNAKISPLRMAMDTSSTAATSPKRLVSRSTRRKLASAGAAGVAAAPAAGDAVAAITGRS